MEVILNFYTYVYRDPSRGMEPFYVGKGKGNRARYHQGRSDKSPMTHRIQLMKRNGIEPDIEIIGAINEDHAFFMESCLIEMLGRRDLKTGALLNLTDGGDGASGLVHSPSTKAKISAASMNMSPETLAKKSASQKGKRHSDESRAKMSIAQRNRSPETIDKISTSHKGKKASPEARAKMSAAAKIRKASPETRAKISSSKKGKRRSPAAVAKTADAIRGMKRTLEMIEKMRAARWGSKQLNKDTVLNIISSVTTPPTFSTHQRGTDMAIPMGTLWTRATLINGKWHRHFSPEEAVTEAQINAAIQAEVIRLAEEQSNEGQS